MIGSILKILGVLLELFVSYRKEAPSREEEENRGEFEKALYHRDYTAASRLLRERLRLVRKGENNNP